VGYFLQLSISRFGSCFTKKPDFGTPKMESDSFGGFQLLLGSTYIETLVRWVHAVYPFDFPPTMVDGWTFYFILFG
jgi:hypothetical protein